MCHFINAYGPQEYSDQTIVNAFYIKLDQCIKNAQMMECLVLLQMDSNAKLGSEFIQGNPHVISKNGQYLREIYINNELIALLPLPDWLSYFAVVSSNLSINSTFLF